MDIAALLPLFTALPLILGGVLVVGYRFQLLQDIVLFATLIGAVVASAALFPLVSDGQTLAHGIGMWGFGYAIPFVADMFAVLMLVTTAVLGLVCAWFAAASGLTKQRFSAPLILILMAGVFGAILTGDLFNFFVCLEIMLLPSYGLYALTIHSRGGSLLVGGMRLFIASNLLGSTLYMVGVGLVYGTAGSINLAELAGAAKEDPAVALAGSVCLLAMFIKASIVPVHSWLARTYPYTSPAITALFSGLHTKVGVYMIYRIYAVLFDGDERFLWIMIALFSLTMVVGVLGAVGEKTTRSILAFHMVSQLGYIMIGVALFTQLGLAAGIFYLVHHMIVKASLFMSTGAIEVKYGTGELGKVTAMAKREPIMAVAFFVAALSLAGIPPFSGFVAKFSLMMATWEAGEVYALIVMVVVSLITLLSMLKIWGGVFWGDPKAPVPDPAAGQDPDSAHATLGGGVATYTRADSQTMTETNTSTATKPKSRVGFWLAAPAVITAVITLVLGVGGEYLMQFSEVAANNLMDTSSYIEAVKN
ncbi:monovalent cation/H+ antiporter subunit D family protein [Corynebacterium sp.]|uniref:monovalent cation/H+ antiporter subunit D family protein n=1 Tax=Corynebacterium sp. TaxID=1720 RepID=UPI0027B90DCB|nr:monovalent cation/H+ antiporter subunit D family protein [Corynebacterium sp.]